jgi:hypothetical protein
MTIRVRFEKSAILALPEGVLSFSFFPLKKTKPPVG